MGRSGRRRTDVARTLGVLRPPHRPYHVARLRGRLRRARRRPAPVGRPPLRRHRRLAADRGVRLLLGRGPAHRPRPRSRPVRDRGPLPDPARPGRHRAGWAARARDRDRRRDADVGPARAQLERAAGRRPHLPVRAVRARRLPARRRLAPAVRPGRDAVGADPHPHGRRRLPVHAGRLGAAGRGLAGAEAGRATAGPPRRPVVPPAHGLDRRWLPHRPVDPAGRVRLRRPGSSSSSTSPSSSPSRPASAW